MSNLTGKDYRAVVRLSDPDDTTLADPGETCARVPVDSLGWLLGQGLIEPLTPAPAPSEPAIASDAETRAEGNA